MNKIIFFKTNLILLIINIVFWLFVAFYFSFFKFADNPNYWLLKIFLFLEPVCFSVILIGVLKKIKIIYLLGLIFLFINSILSLTDEVGVLDFVSFVLSMLLFVNFILWKLQLHLKRRRNF